MSVAEILNVGRVTPVVELGVGDSHTHEVAALWDVDEWDDPTALWAGIEPFWVDVACRCHEIECFAGRERSTETWEVGTAIVVLENGDGWADYPPTTLPVPFLAIRPGVQIRIGVTVDGVYHVKWRGFVDNASYGYHPTIGETVTLECIDAKGEAGRGELARVDPAVGADELVHQRINRVLNAQEWPTAWRSLETSAVNLIATEFGQAAIDALNRASDSGGGAIYGDLDGRVVYRNSGWLNWAPDEPEDGAIGNVHVGDACPTEWVRGFPRRDFSNRVIIAASDMTAPLVYDDAPNQTLYGVEPFTITDLQTRDNADLTALGDRILNARNFNHAPRIAAVTLNAATGDNVVDLLAVIDPRNPSRVVCRHNAADGREVFNKQCIVTGIRHRITPLAWEAFVSLDDATPWAIGVSDAVWDESQWDVDQWAS
jgi:hypothetical protein